MDLFVQGLVAGLVLSFLMGPIFFMLIRVGIEYGFRSTMIYCSGIWFSDLIYILATYFAISTVVELSHLHSFELYTGILGGSLLIGFGIASLITKPPTPNSEQIVLATATPISLFIKGFVINTFNPFTIVFWIMLSGKLSIEREMNVTSAGVFYAGLYAMLIVTDALKAFLAKKIQQRITPAILQKIRQLLGILLMIFGIVLMIRVIWHPFETPINH
jgi:threonine/homoserine/homoserine lactone efflux protein